MASSRPLLCQACRGRFKSFGLGNKALSLEVFRKCISTSVSANVSVDVIKDKKPTAKAITISQSMRAYVEQVKAHEKFMASEVADYEIGKRHLAHIMGEDPDSFTQQDIDRAIEYLLPSGIFDKKARPILKHPYEIYPRRKAAQFGVDGRPFHWMYFTTIPNYYNVLYDINWKMEGLKVLEDKLRAEKKFETECKPLTLVGSNILTKSQLSDRLVEKIQDKEYNHFLVMMDRLSSHPLAYTEETYIMDFRIKADSQSLDFEPPPVEVDIDGRHFATSTGIRFKTTAEVKVYSPGTGTFSVNGKELDFFTNFLYRETIMSPLSVTNLIGQVDVVANTGDGGLTAMAGAIRLGLSKALTAFVSKDVKTKMRLAGLLTRDPRRRERQKVGQAGARKKYTWKKR